MWHGLWHEIGSSDSVARRPTAAQGRAKGNIEPLRSGALRVRVYAGVDPVTGRPHYLREVIPAGPKAERAAEAALSRLRAEVAERRNPHTSATIDQLLERYRAAVALSTVE